MAEPARIRIGNQTAFSASPLTEPFDYAVARGFDAFEWFPDKKDSGGWSDQDLTPGARHAIKQTALAHGIRLSVHVPWQADPAEPDFTDIFDRELRFADDIGAALLNIHLHAGRGVAAYLEALLPFLKETAAAGLTLAIENAPLTGPGDFNELFRELGARGFGPSSSVGMCLDVGHANLFAGTRNDYLRFVDLLDRQVPIVHVHAHENFGDSDGHLPLFTGPSGRDPSGLVGIIERLKERRFAGSIILEQWPEPRDLLDRARKELLEMIGAEYQFGGSAPSSSSTASAATREGGSRVPGRPGRAQPETAGLVSARKTADGVVAATAAADLVRRTWREKLEWVYTFLADEQAGPVTDRLISVAIYLRMLGTGEIHTSEAGGHHRPSHHARLAAAIHERLARMAADDDNRFIIRKILPWLPSFGRAYTRAEPLTRIRDIAHRNDIPGELKREIKTTLQNKLHRSAGPEDLLTSAALLERITAPGAGCPPAFVEEFRRFHEELEEFFNARSLEARLKALRNGTVDDQAVDAFLEVKARATTPAAFLEMLELLTNLRRSVLDRLRQSPGSAAQDLEMADISLEQFSFPILGRLIDSIESAPADEDTWPRALGCLVLAVENLRFGGFDQEECLAVRSELTAWRRTFDASARLPLLRLAATLERCRRLSDAYTDRIVRLFSVLVCQLGRALRVSDEAIRTFGEAEVRSHSVFQLSRLVDHCLATVRNGAALPPWEAVVPGTTTGLMEAVNRLDEVVPSSEPCIALVRRLEGDEEIPAGIGGMVAGHELPHLSHLSIRAREQQIPFALCVDRRALADLVPLAGTRIVLSVSAKGTKVERADRSATRSADRLAPETREPLRVPDVDLTCPHEWLPLEQVTLANAGSKASGAKRLEELSRRAGAGFATPRSLTIPFAVMNRALGADAATEAEYREQACVVKGLDRAARARAIARLRELTLGLSVPAEIVSGVLECFGHDQALIVRSSASVEDLGRRSAAGLYESVPGVRPDTVDDAVRQVWASLWTDRAVMSSLREGIDHAEVCMGVLIQEMLPADLSWILHTVNPIDPDRKEVYVELAVGLGETLASGTEPGAPYRLALDTRTGTARLLAFASFSHALGFDRSGGLCRTVIDYSKIELSARDDAVTRLGSRLGALGRFLETSIGSPQDIEGLVKAETIYVVQSRQQQLALGSGLWALGTPLPRW